MTKRLVLSGLSMAAMQRSAGMLRVLGHPVRLKLIELIAQRPYTVTELQRLLGQPHNAISQHLNKLKAHDLVHSQRSGRYVRYSTTHTGVIGILRAIHHYEHVHATFSDGEAI